MGSSTVDKKTAHQPLTRLRAECAERAEPQQETPRQPAHRQVLGGA